MSRDRWASPPPRKAGSRRPAAALLLALCAALPAPAAGQYGAPAPQPRPDAPRNQGQPAAPAVASAAELHRGAACLIGRDAAAADALLATAPYSAEERREAVRTLRVMERCLRLRTPIATTPTLLRGALAETLYESRFAALQPPRSPALAALPLLRPEAATTRDDVATLAPSYALAQCTVAGQPGLVRGLLASEPAGPAEQAAFQALNPAFVSCVTGDTRLSVDGRTLRGILAETLYRWSVVQRDGAASPLAAPPAAAS